ncbi:hypothetical protein QTP70_009776 [Hemibagrus guttatus]|uniref:ribonuclease H n=1 Tax=Hemibagrus guttatus TaxID=175788 RepID=A0AAE0Q3S7_9TELE|nr:hypothetical protein QTP70_009776 [Hemibagrus guttatus]
METPDTTPVQGDGGDVEMVDEPVRKVPNKRKIQESGDLLSEPTEIRKQTVSFYSKLYSSEWSGAQVVGDSFLVGLPKLSERAARELDRELSLKELHEALQRMQNGQASGIVMLQELVNVTGSDLSRAEDLAVRMGLRSLRVVNQLLHRWRSALTSEERVQLMDYQCLSFADLQLLGAGVYCLTTSERTDLLLCSNNLGARPRILQTRGDYEVYIDVLPRKHPGGKSTPNVAAPSVMSSKGKTVGASAPGIPYSRDDDSKPSSEEDEGLRTDGPDTGSAIDPPSLKSTNAAWIFTVQGGGKPTIYSPSASDLKDILDLLPNPKDNPIHFVKTLIQTTRNAQLCGADYKFILMTKMGPMYDEDELVAKVAILYPKHDTPEVAQLTDVDISPKQEAEGGQSPARKKKGTKITKVRFIWGGADRAATLITLKDSLTTYLLGKQEGSRDLTQYPLSEDKARGIDKILSALLDQGVVVPLHSSYNTLVNPVSKPNDLCSAFFSVPVSPCTQPLFAFTHRGAQYTWTRLPQGFIDSPAVFSAVVHSSLQDLVLPEGAVVLQYADDLLISAETADICKEATWSLLNQLAQQGFKVSLSKLQFCKTEAEELVALTRACILSAEKDVTIYTDSMISAEYGKPEALFPRKAYQAELLKDLEKFSS